MSDDANRTASLWSALLPAAAGCVLLFLSASAEIVLTREGDRVNAQVTRLVLWNRVPVEWLQISGVRGADYQRQGKTGPVVVDSAQAQVTLTRLDVMSTHGGRIAAAIDRFLKSGQRPSVTLILDSDTGAAKVFGYLLLMFALMALSHPIARLGLNRTAGVVIWAALFLPPALALLWLTASATLTLSRTGDLVDADLHRHGVFGLVAFQSIPLQSVRKADGTTPYVLSDQGQTFLVDGPVDAGEAELRVAEIAEFLDDPGRESATVKVNSDSGFEKAGAYVLLVMFLSLVIATLRVRTDDGDADDTPDDVAA